MIALLDTHAIIWSQQGDARLGRDAYRLIEESRADDLAIADISLLEIALLVDKGRIRLAGTARRFLRKTAGRFRVLSIEADIAQVAIELSLPQADPFDRVITATARVHGLPLITRDQSITQSGLVETVW